MVTGEPGAVAGIGAWGAHLPSRLAAKSPAADVTPRTAGDWDEDWFTMALEAGESCLRMHAERGAQVPVEALLISRSLDPSQAGSWSLLTALGLDDGVHVLELPDGLDSCADALDIAFAHVEAGRWQAALVVAASCRRPALRRGDRDAVGGDGAAAIVVSRAPLIELAGRACVNLRFFWSGGPGGTLVPARLEQTKVIEPGVGVAVAAVLDEEGWARSDVDRYELSSPDPSVASAVARVLEVERAALGGDQPFSYARGAEFMLRLVRLCETATKGDRLLTLNVGERAWAYLWKALDGARGEATSSLPSAERVVDYAEYALLVAKSRDVVASRNINPIDYLRESEPLLRLEGTKCLACSKVAVGSRIAAGTAKAGGRCPACGGSTEPVALARECTVLSYTHSRMSEAERDEPTTYAVCELDGGGRTILEVTGDQDQPVEIGARLRLLLRRGYHDRGHSLYLWKGVPLNG